MDLFIKIMVSVASFWMIFTGLISCNKEFIGRIVFKIFPFFIGLGLGFCALKLWEII